MFDSIAIAFLDEFSDTIESQVGEFQLESFEVSCSRDADFMVKALVMTPNCQFQTILIDHEGDVI
jgi:hypothetical protein